MTIPFSFIQEDALQLHFYKDLSYSSFGFFKEQNMLLQYLHKM